MARSATAQLQHLSLVSKITTELENHLHISEKTLAEFIIELSKGRRTSRDFAEVLKSNGAEMPPSLVETLWTIIQRLQPGNGAAAAASGGPSASARTDVAFPGLAVPDSRERARQLDAELLAEGRGGKDAGPAHPEPGERRRHDAEPGAGGKDRHADGRRDRAPRSRSRSRSRSPRHHSSKRPRRYSRSPSPRERRPPRGKDGGRDRNLPPPPPPPPLADKPEQFGVYRGRVSNVMEFGCFVELLGLRSKAEGLVHLANIAKTRRGPAYPLVRV